MQFTAIGLNFLYAILGGLLTLCFMWFGYNIQKIFELMKNNDK